MSINDLEEDGTFDWVHHSALLTVAHDSRTGKLRFDQPQVRRCVPFKLTARHLSAEGITELCESAEFKLRSDLRAYSREPVTPQLEQELHISFEQAKVAMLRVLAPNV